MRFENFIMTGSNEEAYYAAKHVATADSRQFGFLCIFGDGPGVGKTHLLRSIQREIEELVVLRQVCYSTADEFAAELIQALCQHDKSGFYQKYKEVDVLLMDDLHILEGMPHVQKELLCVLEELYAGGKDIVVAVDGVCGQLPDYMTKFMVRLDRGSAAKLGIPDFAGRIKILENKLAELTKGTGKTYSPDKLQAVMEYIAEKETSDVRRLMGALSRCVAFAELLDSDMDLELARKLLE